MVSNNVSTAANSDPLAPRTAAAWGQPKIVLLACMCLVLMAVLNSRIASAAYHNVAQVKMLSNAEGAQQLFEAARAMDPHNPRVYVGLAQLHLRQGDRTAALDILNQALQQAGYDPQVHLLLGDLYAAQGKDTDAILHWRMAGAASLFFSRAVVSEAQGQLDEAARLYTTATNIEPTYVEAWQRLGSLYERMGRAAEAAAAWERAAALHPRGSSRAMWALGESLRLRGEWDAAIQAYRSGIEADPGDTRFYIHLAWAYYFGKHDLDAALAQIERAIAIRPDEFSYYAEAGNLLRAEGHYDEAALWYQRAAQVAPHEGWPLYLLGVNALQQGRPSQAIRFLEEAINKGTRQPQVYYSLGVGYAGVENWQASVEALERAVALSSNPPFQYYLTLAESYLGMGDTERACSAWQNALRSGAPVESPTGSRLESLCNPQKTSRASERPGPTREDWAVKRDSHV